MIDLDSYQFQASTILLHLILLTTNMHAVGPPATPDNLLHTAEFIQDHKEWMFSSNLHHGLPQTTPLS